MCLHIQHAEAIRLKPLRCNFRNRNPENAGDL
jgi:hypothetical protein